MLERSVAIEKKVIEDYVKKNTYKEPHLIKEDTLLFREGFFDSMGFVLLIDFLEDKFSIKTFDEDLVEENFESKNAITEFVSKKVNKI
jgi:acyl carrier protein